MVDIGTNSIHMLVVRVDADLKFHVIDKAKEMVRLGAGTFETGRLDEATQRRGLDALVRFRRTAERRGVERFLAVATSAVREAENGGAFLQEVYELTGIRAQIVSGAEEARLCFKAVQNTMPLDDEPVLVVDLGGGSAQFALGTARQLAWTASLKLGVQRLEGVALRAGEVTPEGHRALHEALARDLAPVAKRAKAAEAERCVVTSGSAGAVLRVLRERGEAAGGDKDVMPRKALADLDDELARVPRKERAALPGVEAPRADQLPGAVAFFRALAEALDLDGLRVADVAMREGLVYDFLDRHGAELQWELLEPNTRRRAVVKFAERFQYDVAHAHHVAHLAVSLFDATRSLHHLDEAARELLEYGALLHDIGYAVAAKAHQKHSEYLILHGLAATGGFTEREVRVIAALARYHRKALPKSSHETFAVLDEDERKLVTKAAALLRIADGLDRGHNRVVEGVRVAVEPGTVRLELDAHDDAELEAWGALRKADLFEEAYGRAIEIRTSAPPPSAPPAAEGKEAKPARPPRVRARKEARP